MPQKFGPPLIAVKSFDHFALVGIGVSHEGRVFASAPAAKSGNKLVEVNVHTGAVTPYPNQSWNVAGPIPNMNGPSRKPCGSTRPIISGSWIPAARY